MARKYCVVALKSENFQHRISNCVILYFLITIKKAQNMPGSRVPNASLLLNFACMMCFNVINFVALLADFYSLHSAVQVKRRAHAQYQRTTLHLLVYLFTEF